MRLNIRIPADNKLKRDVFEEFLNSIHFMTAKKHKPITFGIENVGDNISFFIHSDKDVLDIVKSQLFAFYPDFQVSESLDAEAKKFSTYRSIRLAGKKYLKVQCYNEINISIIPSIVSEMPANSSFTVTIDPIRYDFLEKLGRDIHKMFVPAAQRTKDDNFNVSIVYASDDRSDKTGENLNALLNRLCKKDTNRFVLSGPSAVEDIPGTFVLSTEEVATIFYFPYKESKVAQIKKIQFSTAEPPEELPTADNTDRREMSLIGEATFRSYKKVFGIRREDRNKHLYIVGRSGMGKTYLLKLLMIEDIFDGKGFAYIDPHGDASKEILAFIPKERLKDVIYFNCTDFDYPVGFNPLANINHKYKHNAVDSFVEIFQKLFGVNWNERLEHILRYAALALLDSPEPSLLGLKNLLTDKDFRQYVIGNVKDPVVKAFWANEFADWRTKYEAESVLPIINKLSQLLANPIIRNIFIQTKNTLDMNVVMNNNKILICNLASGELGEENSNFIGSMLVTKIQQCAMERAAIDREARKDFYLYVDEFQNFATDSFINIFSEARKYNLNLTVAHQYIKQLPEQVKDTVFGNSGSMIMFRVGMQDAEFLIKEFNPPFELRDMVNLGIRDIYVKLCINGKTSKPFSAVTLQVPKFNFDFTKEIINESRSKYAQRAEEVESDFAKQDERYKLLQEYKFEEPIL